MNMLTFWRFSYNEFPYFNFILFIGSLPVILSTSLTSIDSYTQSGMNNGNNIDQMASQKNQASLLSTMVTNQLTQFTRFMYSQTFMFKSDNLMGQLHLNPNQFLASVFEPLDLTGVSLPSNLISQSSSSSSLTSLNTIPHQQQMRKPSDTFSLASHTSISTTTSTSSKASTFTSNTFNLFGFMRKSIKQDIAPAAAAATQQKDLQQQKLKQQRTDHKTITQYIKSFEAIVIKSLRQYTFTTSVNLQTRILELLAQLIFLKVDYCLLDSDKVFIDYVLKQFDYLEQKRTTEGGMSTSSSRMTGMGFSDSNSTLNTLDWTAVDENGSGLLANSYSVDLHENFDSETEFSDPLNPFDLDMMLNKLCARLNNSQSSSLGAGGSSFRFGHGGGGGFSSGGTNSTACNTPIISSLVLKQQEHQRNHILIPKLFDFLILLSHEKKQPPQAGASKQPANTTRSSYKSGNGLLTIPEVMQLCDNLVASENSPHTHAIPALRPLVIDLFLNRTSNDTKELDMQQDVLMMSLIRLIQYPQIWPLLTIVSLKYKKGKCSFFTFSRISKILKKSPIP